jgi:hypothetical protein
MMWPPVPPPAMSTRRFAKANPFKKPAGDPFMTQTADSIVI